MSIYIEIAVTVAPSIIDLCREQAESSVCMLSVQGRQHSVEVQYLQRPTSDYIKSAVDTGKCLSSIESLFLTS